MITSKQKKKPANESKKIKTYEGLATGVLFKASDLKKPISLQ
ncbi:MAG: hypothetical protein ACLTT1_14665 [[Clostridium] scindens]